ncbi:MAG: hypothetical protein ABID84_03990 [Chloroflexota bacterium]
MPKSLTVTGFVLQVRVEGSPYPCGPSHLPYLARAGAEVLDRDRVSVTDGVIRGESQGGRVLELRLLDNAGSYELAFKAEGGSSIFAEQVLLNLFREEEGAVLQAVEEGDLRVEWGEHGEGEEISTLLPGMAVAQAKYLSKV